MVFKKKKAVLSAVLAAAITANAMIATVASAAVNENIGGAVYADSDKYGNSTYAERFMSLYDDVVTNGVENGYMSKNGASSSSFGIPFHAVEEVIIEAPDYGHETTSEAMSYLVWVAAMRDNIVTNHKDQLTGTEDPGTAGDLAKAWKTMENMIPSMQTSFMAKTEPSAQYCGEYDNASQCPDSWAGMADKTAVNPIHKYFTTAYSTDSGLYLMHWLGDVENWYGFGTGTDFTFINTFQRGEQESCWETVPQPCVEEKKYGNPQRGIKGIFNTDADVAAQYAYTNAPDAEDRAIQGVYNALQWKVADSSVVAKAAKMGDQLRNNMFDKYYQEIKVNTSTGNPGEWQNAPAGGVNGNIYSGAHYLMNWYTSWGGAINGDWTWQIGCSHAHQFYQNPLAAFALIQDEELKSGMKGQNAVTDYTTSLERQIEFYLWLQSSNGPFAGGATNSYHGRYEAYPSGISTFNGMMYVEHPVYADPGSNHWIGNQVWSTQRLAELYYWVKANGDTTGVKPGGMSLEAALEQILDKWVAWFVNNTVLTEDGDFYMPSNLDWSGQPDTWSGTPSANTGLTCEITGYGSTDFGCLSSLANTLTYYAKAKGVKSTDIVGKTFDVGGSYASGIEGVGAQGGTVYSTSDAQLPVAGLYLAQQLVDRIWDVGRDDIGLTRTDHNGSFARMFSQDVFIPSNYTGTMPNGDELKNGVQFLDIRSMYLDSSKCKGAKTSDEAIALVKELQAAYEKDVAAGADWESMAADDVSASSQAGRDALAEFTNVASVDLQYHRFWHAGDALMALGTFADLYPDLEPTIQYGESDDIKWGDVNVDDVVDVADVIDLCKATMGSFTMTAQGAKNADVDQNGTPDTTDASYILQSLIGLVTLPVTAAK